MAGILVDPNHAEAMIGRRLRLNRRRATVGRNIRVNAPRIVRIASCKIDTCPVGRECVPHTAPVLPVAGLARPDETEILIDLPGVYVDRNYLSLLYRTVTGVVDTHIDFIA
jgi:hypothetical protein